MMIPLIVGSFVGFYSLFGGFGQLETMIQQIMAGSRNWSVPYISRQDLFSLTEECAQVTKIPYVMDAYREEALAIIDQ